MSERNAWRAAAAGVALLGLAGCAFPGSNAPLPEGPAIVDVVTPFDEALMCLNGRIDRRLSFAVGGIPDLTGREHNNGDGAGRFVTQGAGDMVQSALFTTGVTLINRRDMGASVMESQWGIRDLSTQRQAHLVITGSINSLDFIPGAGAWVNIGGIGPRYRQHRILVGLDLALTNVATGQIMANISLLKQVYADEFGIMAATFEDDRVVDVDLGGGRREALHFALRQMLQLGTFELLTQLMPQDEYAECAALVDAEVGSVTGERTASGRLRIAAEEAAAAAEAAAAEAEVEAIEAPAADVADRRDAPMPVSAAEVEAATAAGAEAPAPAPAPEAEPELQVAAVRPRVVVDPNLSDGPQ